MKRSFKLILLLFIAVSAQAQWKIGPKASFGTVTLKSSQIQVMPTTDYLTYDFVYMGNQSVRSLGFMAFNDIGPIYLQAEILATQYDLEFSVFDYKSNDGAQYYTEKHYILELPVAAGVNIGNFKLGLGPVFEFNIDHDSELSSMESYVPIERSAEFGFQWMAGYRYSIFHFDLRYVNKFNSLVDSFKFGYDEFKYNKSADRFTLSVGMAF